MKNTYIQEVKKRLRKYRDLQAQHRIRMSRMLSAGDPYSNMSTDYSSISAKTNNHTSRMEQAIIKSDEYITCTSFAARELQELDMAMEPLNEMQKKIIKLKYIETYNWDIVSHRVGYSDAQCKREGKAALTRMADILYGEVSYTDLPLYGYLESIV